MVESKLSFDDAQTACRREGAHLVTVQSQRENNFLRAFTFSLTDYSTLWLGGTYSNGQLDWVDRQESRDSFVFPWEMNEPSQNGCVLFSVRANSMEFGFWSIKKCSARRGFGERRLLPFLSVVGSPAHCPCCPLN